MMQWLRIIWYVLTLRCNEAERCRCAPDQDALARHQVIAERLHRILCRSCRRAKRKLEIVDCALSQLGSEAELDSGLGLSVEARDRMQRALVDADSE